jgi:predicted acetyltransferase
VVLNDAPRRELLPRGRGRQRLRRRLHAEVTSALVALDPLVVLEPINRAQATVLQNLVELYAHDFSEFVPLEIKSNGLFDVSFGDVWWTRDDHFPFFIRWNGKLAGFALARRGSRITNATDVMGVAEFFVLRGARGKNVGVSAAHALFTKFPGPWEIRVRQENAPARVFWSRAIEMWTGSVITSSAVSLEGVSWDVFRIP